MCRQRQSQSRVLTVVPYILSSFVSMLGSCIHAMSNWKGALNSTNKHSASDIEWEYGASHWRSGPQVSARHTKAMFTSKSSGWSKICICLCVVGTLCR